MVEINKTGAALRIFFFSIAPPFARLSESVNAIVFLICGGLGLFLVGSLITKVLQVLNQQETHVRIEGLVFTK